MLLFFQLVTQCNAKYVECFSAQKECNKEKNRNSSVVPCKILTAVQLDCVFLSLRFCVFGKEATTTTGKSYA